MVLAQSIVFHDCFAWLHRIVDADVGVVICGSSEYEAAATHQTIRVLADRLAEGGFPTLRFDYPGCGDSLGDPDPNSPIDENLQAIELAIDYLKEKTGVREIVLIGVRLGATLAAMTAGQRDDVTCLVLIRPILRGKLFVSEQFALNKILSARAGATDAVGADNGAVELKGLF